MRVTLRGESRRTVGHRLLRWVEYLLLGLGVLALGVCALVYFQARFYQAREGRQFGSGKPPVTIRSSGPRPIPLRLAVRDGSPLSRLDIPRLAISVVVVEGVTSRNLRLGLGHIPGTAFPDEFGNVGIAGHRDTFLRQLRKIHPHDLITLTTLTGSYQYSVDWTRVVRPRDVTVLDPVEEPILTIVTCYPFYWVGSAPERFIVRAKQIGRPELEDTGTEER
jgi:sortase A